MDLTWHGIHVKFDSVANLRRKLMDSFPEYVSSDPDFQVGYLEGRGRQKRWIVRVEDLTSMYEAFYEGDEVRLWCDGKGRHQQQGPSGRKRKLAARDENEEETSEKEKNEMSEKKIRVKLVKEHGEKYSGPQYTLWAKFIKAGRHDSYENPPPIPLMTGEQKGRPQKKESFSDAIVGAATAFTQALKSPSVSSTQSASTSPSSKRTQSIGLSPNNAANLRRHYLEDLRTLSQLLNDGVLTQTEFQEQKDKLLSGLQNL